MQIQERHKRRVSDLATVDNVFEKVSVKMFVPCQSFQQATFSSSVGYLDALLLYVEREIIHALHRWSLLRGTSIRLTMTALVERPPHLVQARQLAFLLPVVVRPTLAWSGVPYYQVKAPHWYLADHLHCCLAGQPSVWP